MAERQMLYAQWIDPRGQVGRSVPANPGVHRLNDDPFGHYLRSVGGSVYYVLGAPQVLRELASSGEAFERRMCGVVVVTPEMSNLTADEWHAWFAQNDQASIRPQGSFGGRRRLL